MRHRVRGRKLGRTASHRKAMLSNLVCSLITHGRVKTTLAKAKEVRGLAERLVTFAKDGSLHARRNASRYAPQKKVIQRLFSELGPRFKDRVGGYTRIYKAGLRAGDTAPMALIEYVGETFEKSKKGSKKAAKETSKKTKTEEKKKAKPASGEKESRKAKKAKAEAKAAVNHEAADKKSLVRKSSKGTGRSGSSKKGVS